MGFIATVSSMKQCPLIVSLNHSIFFYVHTSVIHAYFHVLAAITFHHEEHSYQLSLLLEGMLFCMSVYEQK